MGSIEQYLGMTFDDDPMHDALLFTHGTYYNPSSRLSKMKLWQMYVANLRTLDIAQGAMDSVSLYKFLQLQRDIQKTETVSSNTKTQTPTLLKPPNGSNILPPEAQQILDETNKEVTKNMLQNFLDLYMAPFGISDMQWRLGNVVGVKPNVVKDPVTGFPGALISPQTNPYGAMYTRTNLVADFGYKTLAPGGTIRKGTDQYINLFFPPYKMHNISEPVQTLLDIKAFYADKTNPYYIEDEATRKAVKTFDVNTGQIMRADYTYREPAFKAINDNIMLLQYIFEQSTGIVSTYLTEWDLSVYFQEGLLTQTYGRADLIWLLHRILSDNPYGYTDDRAMSFGVTNAATSKIFESNKLIWDPGTYPLSAYWKVPTIKYESSDKMLAPTFYAESLADFSTAATFKDKVTLFDKKNATLAGWFSWAMPYWKALYSGPGDGLTNADITSQLADMNNLSARKIADINAQNSLGNSDNAGSSGAGTQIILSGAKTFLTPLTVTGAGGYVAPVFGATMPGPMMEGPGVQVSIGGGGGGDAGKAEKSSPGSGATGFSSNDAMKLGQKMADGYMPSASQFNDIPQNKKPAISTGVPQRNPPFYGGPHGRFYSPKSPQSYFEEGNLFMRDMPRISGNKYNGFENNNPNAYAESADRMYYDGGPERGPNYGKTDQCPALGMHHFLKGDCTFTWQLGYILREVSQRFKGAIIQVRWCSAYASYTGCRGPAGETITRWANDEHWEWTYYWQDQTSWNGSYWFGSYYWYWNKYARSYWRWNGSRYQYYVAVYTPYRTGYYTTRIYSYYKRYTLTSKPTAKWAINQFNNPEVYAVTTRWNWWPYSWLWWWGGAYVTYTVAFRNVVRYKLGLPDVVGREIDMGSYSAYQTRNELEVMEKMICNTRGTSPVGHENTLIFCEGSNQSYGQRMADGPETIFKLKCSIKRYNILYYRWFIGGRRHRCHYDWWWYSVPYTHGLTYIDVDPTSVEWIRTNLNKDPWTNLNSLQENMLDGNIPTDDFLRNKVVFENLFAEGRDAQVMATRWWQNSYSSYGIRGYGILSGIQGLESDAESSAQEGDVFKNHLNLSYVDPNVSDGTVVPQGVVSTSVVNSRREFVKNQRMIDIKRTYVDFTDYDETPRTDEWGNKYYVIGGVPVYKTMGRLDPGLNRAINRMFTTSTFYKVINDGHAYLVGMDPGLRTLSNQILRQQSFLETTRDYLLDENSGIDFNSIFLVLTKCIDQKIIAVSDRDTLNDPDPDNRTYDPGAKDYNYWLDRALQLFKPGNFNLVRRELKNAINSRIDLYNVFITNVSDQLRHIGLEWSFNQTSTVFDQIKVIQNNINRTFSLYQIGINDISIDEFFFCYLNVLYEYRKFFINKRFNKQDGTMWMLRQLESVIPTFVEKANVETPPSLKELAEDSGAYAVSFYDVQNTIDQKVKALRGQIPALDPDKITRVYIKVLYTTEKEYNKSIRLADRKVVKVNRPIFRTEKNSFGETKLVHPLQIVGQEFVGYAQKPIDGAYYLESKERQDDENNVRYNQTVPPDKPMLRKVIREDMDFAQWDIKWGTESDKTPIFFAAFTGVQGEMLRELMATNGLEDDVFLTLCNSKSEDDFWTVSIPKTEWPRATGYLNDVMIKQYIPHKQDTITDEDKLITSVAGVFGYALYPITEQQSKLIAGSPVENLIDELKSKTLSTTITKPASATS